MVRQRCPTRPYSAPQSGPVRAGRPGPAPRPEDGEHLHSAQAEGEATFARRTGQAEGFWGQGDPAALTDSFVQPTGLAEWTRADGRRLFRWVNV